MVSKSITIKDIAKALNISCSTVSRALKDSYRISKPVKEIVKEYARKHNYRPNLMAQSLKNKKSRSIGISLCSIPNSFFAEVISGMESVAYDKDYKIIITQSFESLEREVKNIEHLAWHAVDGILVSLSTETTDTTHLKKLHENGIPIVFFDRISDQINTHTVTVDNKQGASDATMHLLQEGFKNIAHITSSPELSITKERLEGYYEAIDANKFTPNQDYIKYCMHGGMLYEEVEQAINELFSLAEPPDAIIAASDRITLHTVSVLKKKEIRIPSQVALIGFSNFSAPDIIEPSLTTIKQPAFDMGKKAMELLIQLIEAKRPVKYFEKIVLPAELEIRESSIKKGSL
ncbi:MAG: LacI family DNA-binding transcriptional regulator [Lacibacter sp.]